MAHQLILQPNGLLAIYSTVSDSFINANLTANEAVEQEARENFAGDLKRTAVWVAKQIADSAGEHRHFWKTMAFVQHQHGQKEYDHWLGYCTKLYSVGEGVDPLKITLEVPTDHIFLLWEGTGASIGMRLHLPPFLSFEAAAAYVAKKHNIGIDWHEYETPMTGEVRSWYASPGGEAGFSTQFVRIAETIPVP